MPFKLENSALLNGMSCHGDTLTLPAGHGCNKLHILAAAATDDRSLSCDFKIGKSSQTITIPSYTGFIGQWGHDGHTKGYLTDDQGNVVYGFANATKTAEGGTTTSGEATLQPNLTEIRVPYVRTDAKGNKSIVTRRLMKAAGSWT